ncbi:MAG: M15 family metallopeptidase, partial [Defluviitaleaceae bacterium]|nr:M15 family metallopeptidase [Defluviitaleaceae bacterium]
MSIGIDSRNIDDLHPAVARGCRAFINRMSEAGFPHVGISATYRDVENQNWLFGQGRPNEVPYGRAGTIVTNARGGQSIHNYRLAFDFFRNVSGQAFNDS